MNLNDYAEACHDANKKWWTNLETEQYPIKRNKGELIALMHSELSEMLEGVRKDLMDDKLPHRKAEEVELVDLLIRAFDYAGAYGLNIQKAYEEKMAYNSSRIDHTLEHRRTQQGKKF